MKYTEADFQEGRILGFFTDKLQWKENVTDKIDKDKWLIPSELQWFLKNGNNANNKSFLNLLNNYSSDEELVEDFIDKALLPKLKNHVNAASVLREQISFKNQIFTLFNEPNIVGSSHNANELFDKNSFTVIQEASFEKKFHDKKFNRRPDLTFFINGIYFSYSELKLSTQGQSASNQGREKIANNFIEAVSMSIDNTLLNSGYSLLKRPSWSEIASQSTLCNQISQDISLFAKAVHITTVDDSQVYIINNIAQFIPEIYDAMKENLSSQRQRLLKEILPLKIKKTFEKMPNLRDQTLTESVMTHLECLYHRESIYSEIEYFNFYNDRRYIRPRAAQRAMFYATKEHVKSLYFNELTPKLSPDKIRQQLVKSLPNLSEADISLELKELMKYKNGQDQHSILLQGAAGLGKTNLIVWLAYHLTSMNNPSKLLGSKPIQEKLFDTIVILTDRTELRKNIAKDATKTIAVEAKTTPDLVAAIRNNSKIVIYNIQKTSGLKKALSQDLQSDLSKKRIAFLIDEVHRSQNGELNKETIELFDACSGAQQFSDKRNLIIGLTATPTDDILAKYGEWKATCSPTDKKNWVPYFSYTMREAIEGGYILDPTKNILTVTERIDYIDFTGDNVEPSTNDIYSNVNRQKLAASEIARIFVNQTMNAIRPEKGRNSFRGDSKAIDVESSIAIAIQMKPLIEEALINEANKVLDNIPATATKKTREAAEAKSEAIKNIVVTLVFSDTANDKCSYHNDGLNEDGIIKKFRCEGSQYGNAIMIVVDKLLTGFDEPTLHTIFINKNMSDVSLFQAVCRVNRIHANKKDCLVVDMSHGNTVAKAIPEVFQKYGDVTVSNFEAFTWQEKLNYSYKYLFSNDKNTIIMEQFKLWKTWADNKKTELPIDLINNINDLFTGSSADMEKAVDIWKNCAQWLNTYDKLKFLLDFSSDSLKKHNSLEKRQFAEILRKTIFTKIEENKEKIYGQLDFDVIRFEETHGAIFSSDIEDELPTSNSTSQKESSKPGTCSVDAMEILNFLQNNEESKEKIISEIHEFMKALFKEIDNKSQIENNDSFRKEIKSGADISWEDKLNKFQFLYRKATNGVSKVRLSKNRPLYTILDASFKTKMSLLESDYEMWVLGESYLNI